MIRYNEKLLCHNLMMDELGEGGLLQLTDAERYVI